MHTLLTLLYWLAYLAPIWINAYITLASYLLQRKCNTAIYQELERLRHEHLT